MIPVNVKLAIGCVAILASFAGGYWLCDTIHDGAEAEGQRDAIEDARKDDRSNQDAADDIERDRIGEEKKADVVYRYIDREVINYVRENPSPDGCGLDAHGLSLWRAARDAQPVNSSEPIK